MYHIAKLCYNTVMRKVTYLYHILQWVTELSPCIIIINPLQDDLECSAQIFTSKLVCDHELSIGETLKLS